MPKFENRLTTDPGETEQETQRVLDYRRLDAETKELWRDYRDKKSPGERSAANRLWNDMNAVYEALYNNEFYQDKPVTTEVVDNLIKRSRRMREFLETVN